MCISSHQECPKPNRRVLKFIHNQDERPFKGIYSSNKDGTQLSSSTPTPVSGSHWSTHPSLRHYSSSFLKGVTQQWTMLPCCTVAIDIQMTGALRKRPAPDTKFTTITVHLLSERERHKPSTLCELSKATEQYGGVWRVGYGVGVGVEMNQFWLSTHQALPVTAAIHPLWNTGMG